MDNLFERPDIISMEALVILEDELKDFRNNITDIIDCPGLSVYGENKIPGAHYLDIVQRITARNNVQNVEEFTKDVIKPSIIALANVIKKLKGEYAFYKLPLLERHVCAISIYKNIGIRIVRGYNMYTLSSEIAFEIVLIEIKEFV